MRTDADRSTARDRPPEEAAEDTSFARGLRVLLTIADRGEVRADELGVLLDTPVSTIYRYHGLALVGGQVVPRRERDVESRERHTSGRHGCLDEVHGR